MNPAGARWRKAPNEVYLRSALEARRAHHARNSNFSFARRTGDRCSRVVALSLTEGISTSSGRLQLGDRDEARRIAAYIALAQLGQFACIHWRMRGRGEVGSLRNLARGAELGGWRERATRAAPSAPSAAPPLRVRPRSFSLRQRSRLNSLAPWKRSDHDIRASAGDSPESGSDS
jgi:hypothetical protein